MTLPANTSIYPDAEALAQAAAEWLLRKATAGNGLVTVCLSGGTTPRRLYELIATPPLLDTFPWARLHWFWGDERWVPHDHPRSNYHMVDAALLRHAPIPAGNVHPIPYTGSSPEADAAAYDELLRRFARKNRSDPNRALFDVTLLGLGEDGHTASLFPKTPALAERTALACAATGPEREPRITLTYPALDNSCDIAFLVAGAGKRAALSSVWRGENLPAAAVRPHGALHWFVDRAAAPANT